MLRLITSRWVRLALAAAVATAIVVAVLRLRRPRLSAVSGAGSRVGTVPGAGPPVEVAPRAEPGRTPSWPPTPILGTPTADDLGRYAVASRLPAFLSREVTPRAPLDHAVRRRLTRWGAVVCALCLVALGAQVLENATFSGETGAGNTHEAVVSGMCPPYGDTEWRRTEEDPYACWKPGNGPYNEFPYRSAPSDPSDPSDPLYDGSSGLTATRSPGPATSETVQEARISVRDADCHPTARVPRRRPLSPRVTRAVDRQWTRIEKWLRINAPESYRTLATPARAGTIAVAEAQMGLRFPDDLRASLLRHNGSVATDGRQGFGLIGDEQLMNVRRIRDTWRALCEGDGGQEAPESGLTGEWWDGRMVPFGADGVGGHLLVDSVRRNVGEISEDGPPDFAPGGVRIRSYYALLKATADALETGGTIGHWKPGVTGGRLNWHVVGTVGTG